MTARTIDGLNDEQLGIAYAKMTHGETLGIFRVRRDAIRRVKEIAALQNLTERAVLSLVKGTSLACRVTICPTRYARGSNTKTQVLDLVDRKRRRQEGAQ